MKEAIQKFWKDEEGATAIEYGLIAGLIAVALVTVLGSLGGGLEATFQKIVDKLPGKASTTTSTQ